jgi:hypothetical protein
MKYMRNTYKVLIGKLEGKIHLGRLRHRQKNIIKMDLREIGSEGAV